MSNHKILKVPNNVHHNFTAIVAIIKTFCDDKLNEEYYNLALKLTAKIARKRPSPLSSGKAATWAAAIIHALGMVNFLFDKSQTPHIQSTDISDWFNLSTSTISAKSKSIRDMISINQFDYSWTLPSKMDDHPMMWMVMVDGFIIDIRQAPYELQLQALESGVIPYIPCNSKLL
jgi:hypothetical protein